MYPSTSQIAVILSLDEESIRYIYANVMFFSHLIPLAPYPHTLPFVKVALRLIALTVMSGVVLIFLQPPMPIRGGSRCPKLPLSLCPRLWDERHIPMHGTEDVEVGESVGDCFS